MMLGDYSRDLPLPPGPVPPRGRKYSKRYLRTEKAIRAFKTANEGWKDFSYYVIRLPLWILYAFIGYAILQILIALV